jgi:hypothetical protein
MSVLFDYFRAPDAKTASRVMDSSAGPRLASPAFDGVETKLVEPIVVLGQLVGFIREVPWEVDIVATTMIWPPPETEPKTNEAYNKLPENSPWKTGPWLQELGPQVRDALASVDDGRLTSLAAQWAIIEEFDRDLDVEILRSLIQDLVNLARRARDHGDRLYCWTCL